VHPDETPANRQVRSFVYGDMWKAAGVAAVLAICLGIAAPSAGAGSPPWVVLSSGGAVPVPGGGDAGAVIIASQKALTRYTPVALVPGGYPPHGWQNFDWAHNVVLLVVARNQSAFPEIAGLTRQQARLRIVIAAPADGSVVAGPTWTAIRVSRSVIGRPLPKRLIVVTAQHRP
jgi:hypothetical protein